MPFVPDEILISCECVVCSDYESDDAVITQWSMTIDAPEESPHDEDGWWREGSVWLPGVMERQCPECGAVQDDNELLDAIGKALLDIITASSEGPRASVTVTNHIDPMRLLIRDSCTRMGLSDAYEVGGCIRDEMLGRPAKDWDVAVVGMEFQDLYDRVKTEGQATILEVGGQLVGVRLSAPWVDGDYIEFALARTEVSTGPGHKDFAIVPGVDVSLQEDLSRRDFTVNAMARSVFTGQLFDPYGGAQDLTDRHLRMVSDTAFRDDPLRILRGLARVSKDGLDVESATWNQMQVWSSGIQHLSRERVWEEYTKIISGSGAYVGMGYARDLSIIQDSMPLWGQGVGFDQESKYHDLTVDQHQLLALQRACEWGYDDRIKWAAMIHDIGKPDGAWRDSDNDNYKTVAASVSDQPDLMAARRPSAAIGEGDRLHYYANPRLGKRSHEDIGVDYATRSLEAVKAPKELQKDIAILIKNHMYKEDDNVGQIKAHKQGLRARRFISRVGRDHALLQMQLRRCDRGAKSPEVVDAAAWDRDQNDFESLVRREWHQPLTVKELAVNGNDLVEIGFKGPALGETLRALNKRIIEQPELNTRDRLIKWAQDLNIGPTA